MVTIRDTSLKQQKLGDALNCLPVDPNLALLCLIKSRFMVSFMRFSVWARYCTGFCFEHHAFWGPTQRFHVVFLITFDWLSQNLNKSVTEYKLHSPAKDWRHWLMFDLSDHLPKQCFVMLACDIPTSAPSERWTCSTGIFFQYLHSCCEHKLMDSKLQGLVPSIEYHLPQISYFVIH